MYTVTLIGVNKMKEITMQEAISQFLKALEAEGKNPRTLYTYGQDCKQILTFFGPEKKLTKVLPVHVAQFYKSDELLKVPKNGKHRAKATINKTIRVFRMLLTWAKEQGHIKSLPLPKNTES
jgi:site-specific recombinase XerD